MHSLDHACCYGIDSIQNYNKVDQDSISRERRLERHHDGGIAFIALYNRLDIIQQSYQQLKYFSNMLISTAKTFPFSNNSIMSRINDD